MKLETLILLSVDYPDLRKCLREVIQEQRWKKELDLYPADYVKN